VDFQSARFRRSRRANPAQALAAIDLVKRHDESRVCEQARRRGPTEPSPPEAVDPDVQRERSMADNKNPAQKQPGEKQPGQYHYNPGNQSGKTAEIFKDESEQENNVDRIDSRKPATHSRDK
jgi:hypothetical protein